MGTQTPDKLRKIFIVTERRADYSRFKPILEIIHEDPDLDYDLVVTGIHLKDEHGRTINEIKKDGFKIFSTFDMFEDDEDTGASMTRALGRALVKIAHALESSRPDIILSGFDIAANLAATIAGAHMNIPVAHIQGGEVSGTIDESIRHAMSKFSHYHMTANEDATKRLVRMGEIPEHVFNVGCPSLDAIMKVPVIPKEVLFEKFNLKPPYALVLQHAVTTEVDCTNSQIHATLEAVAESKISALIIMPNNDAGSSQIIKKIKKMNIQYVATLSLEEYVNLLRHSSILIGNSSSGIHETATFGVPTINVGTRQSGRLRARNVLDVNHDKKEILKAIDICLHSREFIERCASTPNPYGDGASAPRIVKLLKEIDIGNEIIQKRITY